MKKIEKRMLIIIIIVFILLISAISIFAYKTIINAKQDVISNNLAVSQNQVKAENPNLNKKTESEYFELQGFGTLSIDSDNPYINLINPESNDVYLSFEVINGDYVLYKTELIEPGLMEQFDIFNCLDAGEHTLIYLINVYDMPNKNVLWSGIKQEQKISITK